MRRSIRPFATAIAAFVTGVTAFIVGLATLAPGIADAHHSISGVYFTRREATIEGVINEFHFVRPHPYMFLTVSAEPGEPQRWRLELDNRFELERIGIGEDTFRPGDRVVATGHPGRDEAEWLYVRRLDRAADGLRYEQVGRSPRVNVDATTAQP